MNFIEINELKELLDKAEKVLCRCQAKFPLSSNYDNIAQHVSNVRGDIMNYIEEKINKAPELTGASKMETAINIHSLIEKVEITVLPCGGCNHSDLHLQKQMLKIEKSVTEAMLTALKNAELQFSEVQKTDNTEEK